MGPDKHGGCQATRHSSTICWSRFQVEVARVGKHICRHVPVGITEVILSQFKMRRRGPSQKELGLDVSRAHFHPRSRRKLYIRQPTVDSTRLEMLRILYGTRDAANAWDEFSNKAAIDQGREIGWSPPSACTTTVNKTAMGGDMLIIWCSKVKKIGLTSRRWFGTCDDLEKTSKIGVASKP